jgi:hypothetical protein
LIDPGREGMGEGLLGILMKGLLMIDIIDLGIIGEGMIDLEMV